MEREGETVRASKEADGHGHGNEQGIGGAQAEGDPLARVGKEVCAQSHAQAYAPSHACMFGDGHENGAVRAGKEEEGRVSETELLIAHVLAAMKNCNLFGKADKSSSSTARMSKAVTQTSSQDFAGIRTTSRARISSAAQTSSSQAHAAASTSSSAGTSSQVKGVARTSSRTAMAAQTSSQARIDAQTSSHTSMGARSSSQENAAALCIASLKRTHNKENCVPSNRTLDMQDERAQPKFKNLADLYK